MSEYIRDVRVHVQVETNKQTYELRLDTTADAEVIASTVRRFIEDIP